jgi:Ca2+-binding EF-hand superfamily protein
MKSRFAVIALGALLTIGATASLMAQEAKAREESSEKYQNRYTHDLFQQADTNHDGYVDFNEARGVSNDFEHSALGKKRFDKADLNHDGRLSFDEARKYKGIEVRNEEKALRREKARVMKKEGRSTVEQPAQEGTTMHMRKKVGVQEKGPSMKGNLRNKKVNARRGEHEL